MKISLIITTYNWKEALDLAFKSIARQTVLPDEIIVADDGSRPDTEELVAKWAQRLAMPVRHLWQEDIGFRASRARNRAIAAAIGDYIIAVDGDMVLNAHFVEDHRRMARRGFFVQGARLLTGPTAAKSMLDQERFELGFFEADIKRRRHTIRNLWLSALVFLRSHTNQKAIRSCNQAYWREDLLKVNGFDEQMIGWGREDNDLAERLYNIGVRRKNLKFAGLATHLHHKSRQPQGENPNDKYLSATIQNKSRRCELGIDQHSAEFAAQTKVASRWYPAPRDES
ncbi:MAG TPA: glycosyltransferase family 2 protein [Steroidobacteraceae bacterium]|nr:glycosyltransferase family 2 protein [Steroidobacteraceae bacterium]